MDLINNSSDISTSWIENLALDELNMEESGVVNFGDNFSPIYLLEESSIDFMDCIKDQIEFFVEKFNQHRGSQNQSNQIRIFKISNTVNDFMLYRNSLRLICARKSNELISIGFLSSSGEIFAPKIQYNENKTATPDNTPIELSAYIGPFNKITWRHNNEVVDIDSLARYCLSEFIRSSAR